jgi:hypothetical protein
MKVSQDIYNFPYHGYIKLLETDGPGIESRWLRGFLHPRPAPGPTQPPVQVPALFPRGKAAMRLKKE